MSEDDSDSLLFFVKLNTWDDSAILGLSSCRLEGDDS